MRRQELARVLGRPATETLSEGWAAWQTASVMDSAKRLRDEWAALNNRQPPLYPELRAALHASRFFIKQAIVAPVRLYRGFDSSDSWPTNLNEVLAAAALGRAYVRLTTRSMNSWSISFQIAREFAGEKGIIVVAMVPPEDIVGGLGLSPGFGAGNRKADELEAVVSAFKISGGDYSQTIPLSQVTSDSWQAGTLYHKSSG